jgi:competence protein ComFC
MPAWKIFKLPPFKLPSIRRLIQTAGNLLLPPICAGCQRDLTDLNQGTSLCETCTAAFHTQAESICPRCAAPAPQPSIRATGCIYCESTPFRFHRISALGVYEGQLQDFVLRMKHVGQEALTLSAGKLIARKVRSQNWNPAPELVTTIPMHWWRRFNRGVNPAAILAEAVAKELHLPLALDLGVVQRAVPRQATLTPNQRRHNMRKVFGISAAYNIQRAHLLVIDDVLTTGATANAFAQSLRLAGAATVSIAVLARGIGVN